MISHKPGVAIFFFTREIIEIFRGKRGSVAVIGVDNPCFQSRLRVYNIYAITSYGWNLKDEVLTIDWDSAENISAVEERVMLLTKGCKCKTG